MARFANAGLHLPDLKIILATTTEPCGGHPGVFRGGSTPATVTICSDSGPVFEHELAHAWEHASMTEEQRRAFMELRGYSVWTGPGVPWNERGIEGVAVIIQQGLSGLPLPSVLSGELLSRVEAFAFLTGRPDPRLPEAGQGASWSPHDDRADGASSGVPLARGPEEPIEDPFAVSG